jgi:hypothetical protein
MARSERHDKWVPEAMPFTGRRLVRAPPRRRGQFHCQIAKLHLPRLRGIQNVPAPMTRGRPAFTPKPRVRLDACEIFHKVVAMTGAIPDNNGPPCFFPLPNAD